jgi:spore maturation protein CgeB
VPLGFGLRRPPAPCLTPSRGGVPDAWGGMNLVVFGLSLSSSWGNGHAPWYREFLREWGARGHGALFLERRQPWYEVHADLPVPGFCRLGMYDRLEELQGWAQEVACADAVIVGSHVPDGTLIGRWVQEASSGVTAFYDLDAGETLERLERGDEQYVSIEELPGYDLYLSTTGGPFLELMERKFGVARACALYYAVSPQRYLPFNVAPRASGQKWEVGFAGNYCPGRQMLLDQTLLWAAGAFPQKRFVVAGASYPLGAVWPANVERIPHLGWGAAPSFYRDLRFSLNLTRPEKKVLGWCPALRMFEAAACGVPTVTDSWEGLSRFFSPGQEVLVARNSREFGRILKNLPQEKAAEIGESARIRLLSAHTVAHRVLELESLILNTAEGRGDAEVRVRQGALGGIG